MNRLMKAALYLPASVFLIFLCVAASADAPPGTQGMGLNWRMASFRCPLHGGDLADKLGRGAEAFAWEDGQYVRVDVLEPGRGYFISREFADGLDALCQGVVFDMANLRLAQGWNLIGNPTRDAVPFSAFIKGGAADQGVMIYTLREDRFESLGPDDMAQPGRGYWIYMPGEARLQAVGEEAWADTKIMLDGGIDTSVLPLSCRMHGTEEIEILLPLAEETQVRVAAANGSADDRTGEILNAMVEWRSENPGVARVAGDRNVLPVAVGTTTVSNYFNGQSKGSQTVSVFDAAQPVCVQIDAPDIVSLQAGQEVALHVFGYFYAPDACPEHDSLCPFVKKNITSDVAWNVGNPSQGAMAGNAFRAAPSFSYTTLGAQFGTVFSQIIQISSENAAWENLVIEPGDLEACDYTKYCGNNLSGYQIAVGDRVPLAVKGFRISNGAPGWDDITGAVSLKSSDTAVAEIVDNTLVAKTQGLVTVTAAMPVANRVLTKAINFSVDAGGGVACIGYDEDTTDIVETMDTYTLDVYPFYYPRDEEARKACELVKGERLTDVVFTNSNPRAGALEGDKLHASFNTDQTTNVVAEWREFRTSHQFRLFAFPVRIMEHPLSDRWLVQNANACDLMTGRKNTIRMIAGDKMPFRFKAELSHPGLPEIYQDRMFENFEDYFHYEVTDPSVIRVKDGYLQALAPGVAKIYVEYPISGNVMTYYVAVSEPGNDGDPNTPHCLMLSYHVIKDSQLSHYYSGLPNYNFHSIVYDEYYVNHYYPDPRLLWVNTNFFRQYRYHASAPRNAVIQTHLFAVYSSGNANCEYPSPVEDYCLKDVSGEAIWQMSDPNRARVDNGIITTSDTLGYFMVSAAWNGLNSDILEYETQKEEIQNISISLTDSRYVFVEHELCTLKAGIFVVGDRVPVFTTAHTLFYSIYAALAPGGSDHTRDVSSLAEYQISDPEIARMENGYLVILKPGTFTLRAKYMHFETDNVLTITAVEKNTDEVLCLDLRPGKRVAVLWNRPLPIKAQALYSSTYSGCETTAENSNYCLVDVTDETTWTSMDQGLLLVDKGELTGVMVNRSTYVSADYKGLVNNAHVIITDDEHALLYNVF